MMYQPQPTNVRNECLVERACHIACSENWEEVGSGKGSESTRIDESSNDGASSLTEATTMMLCNIPCRSTQDHIIEAIHSVGFADTYDFVYVPSCSRGRRAGTRSGNVGYAFVNFKSSHFAEQFAVMFDNYRFPGTRSAKTCTVKYAHIQGFNALYAASSCRSRGKRSSALQ